MKEYHNQNENTIKKYQTLSEKPWQSKKSINLKFARAFARYGNEKRSGQLNDCGTYLEFAKYTNGKFKLHHANFCRARMCPMCSWRKSLKVGYQVSQVLNYATKDKNKKLLFLTLTCKNVEGSELKQTISDLFKAYGVLFTQPRVKKAVKGAFRALEVTYNRHKNTYHPHLHIILLVDHTYASYNDTCFISQREWTEIWKKCLDVDYKPIVDIRLVRPNKRAFDNNLGISAEISKGETLVNEELVNEELGLADYMTKGIVDEKFILPSYILQEVLPTLDDALAGRKMIAYRGELLKISKILELDDVDQGDLVNVKGEDLNDELEYVIQNYHWMFGGYVLTDEFNQPVEISPDKIEETVPDLPVQEELQLVCPESETIDIREFTKDTTFSIDLPNEYGEFEQVAIYDDVDLLIVDLRFYKIKYGLYMQVHSHSPNGCENLTDYFSSW